MQWALESLAAMGGAQAAATAPFDQMLAAPSMAMPSARGGHIDFADLVNGEVAGMNGDIRAAEVAMRDLAAGKPVELHDVMITLERARLSVQTFVQVRNKLIESYQDLMRMQL